MTLAGHAHSNDSIHPPKEKLLLNLDWLVASTTTHKQIIGRQFEVRNAHLRRSYCLWTADRYKFLKRQMWHREVKLTQSRSRPLKLVFLHVGKASAKR